MSTTNDDTTQTTGAAGDDHTFEWHPLDLIRDHEYQKQDDSNDQLQNGSNGTTTTTHKPGRFALVVLNQPLTHLGLVKRLWKNGMFCFDM